ncbi:hypothetical protein [uncultured Amphritea sp.]|uniref:hypothetical protein n=1 Tax=uncultured Amphritea sp. TaxID=981605 RepID=UPI002618A1CC|nr:hypothetical protein [uncultured Amphritea sp.]
MRWLFILLLLTNALYFGWQMRQPVLNHAEVIPANVTRLRLLKEEDRSLLLPRSPEQYEADQSSLEIVESPASSPEGLSQEEQLSPPPELWCQVISGIAVETVALELQGRLEQQGLTSVVVPVDVERVLAYELTLDRPAQPDAQQALIDNLAALGLRAEEARVNTKPVYIIGRYGSRTEMAWAQNALIGLFQPDEYQVVSQESLFEVWVETDSSVETGNKIKEVDQFLNSAIKIEKKSCKGVASTGVRD